MYQNDEHLDALARSQCQPFGADPPRTWDDYESSCIATYRGGHEGAEGAAFVHGMKTVFQLLRKEFPEAYACKRSGELLVRILWLEDYLEAKEILTVAHRIGSHAKADKALARIKNLEQNRPPAQTGAGEE